MTLALLRAVLTEGDVYYDGVRTASINIDALRAQITIIPQSVSPGRQPLLISHNLYLTWCL
jgi:ABC-type multidrug transport system fused ATPase/permease subunit